jgi:glycosyltransferase involved in cell wall biosynthesis
VAVVGAIGIPKGFSLILACAKDAALRNLNLSFTIVGYTIDDDALEATGHVSITGPFAAEEARSLIQAQGAGLAFIPSVWPETWCFALTDAWEAGLPACVFDIGTPAERVRATGFGWVLPLGLPPARVNDRLLALGEGQELGGGVPLSPLVSRGTFL